MPAINPRLIIELFEFPNYSGKSGYFVDAVPDLPAAGFPNGVRSARVFKGPGFKRGPNYRLVLHERRGLRGPKLVLAPGYYSYLLDVSPGFSGQIRSFNIAPDYQTSGPDWGTIPLVVELFNDPGFQGRRAVVLRDVANTHTTLGMADSISSVRVTKGPDFPAQGAKVRLYEHIDFSGPHLEIPMTTAHLKQELPELRMMQMVGGQYASTFGDAVSSVQIEGWASSGEYADVVFDDEFGNTEMDPAWRWVAPAGGGEWRESQGYLEMNVQPGRDLWHGNPPGRGGNMDGPRLLMQMTGDFAIETRIPVTPQLKEHGGILIWRNPTRFLRLEKTSGPHGFAGAVRFERHANRVYSLVGRGPDALINTRHLYLRIERKAAQFTGFASPDGHTWTNCGTTTLGMGDPVQVGLHALCPGSIPATQTRFDYFRVYARPGDGAVLGRGRQPVPPPQMSDSQRLQMMRRFMR